MSRQLRAAIFATFAALWLSGVLWLVLHLAWAEQTAFGPAPNPWEAPALRIHGWLAVGGVFLLGWLGREHISERWTGPVQRISGYSLSAAALVLVLSGYALYYTTDHLHDLAAIAHELLGAAAIVLALAHWQRRRRWLPRAHRGF
jgi:hypothetical protein